jgi:hypothetical protein
MPVCNSPSDRLPASFLEALKRLPAFRFMKAPTDHVYELYERYPHGNERGAFAFVCAENQFYRYLPGRRAWVPAGNHTAFDIWVRRPGNEGKTEHDFFVWLVQNLYDLINLGSLYDLWIAAGNTGTLQDFLDTMRGPQGYSAYRVWVNEGHTGSEADFLEALKGKSAYQIWLSAGNTGSAADFLAALKGDRGDSAYQVWLDADNTGNEQDFLNALKGRDSVSVSAKKTVDVAAPDTGMSGFFGFRVFDAEVKPDSFIFIAPSKATEGIFVRLGGHASVDVYDGYFYGYVDNYTGQGFTLEYVIFNNVV